MVVDLKPSDSALLSFTSRIRIRPCFYLILDHYYPGRSVHNVGTTKVTGITQGVRKFVLGVGVISYIDIAWVLQGLR